MEHRHLRRHRAFALVQLIDYSEKYTSGLVYNISLNGAFILSIATPTVDTIIHITISAPAIGTLLVPISGIVVHRNNNGFGLMFCKQERATRLLVDKLSNSYAELVLK